MECLDKGLVAWFTGLPASGKTTIAKLTAQILRGQGIKAEVLDGDQLRQTINTDLGYTRQDRIRHLTRAAWIARLLARNGIVVLAAFITPYEEARQTVRRIVEEEAPLLLVYTKAPLDLLIKRDPKGLYAKALRGEIKNFTGIDDPFEEPQNPDIVLDTAAQPPEKNAQELAHLILTTLSSQGQPPPKPRRNPTQPS
ncbi:adenylylsulfate kinase [Pyrobaculum islandicum DSM 4184]|uniref:Adenylyl-sulfate kinase n=1 Tax=Pyrobaculum islandicum (strain DSM 4184 / JCM 9189 / GEO3) TaxID=384616 RepID=A1RUN3_PYRIL|nr:adenylyl-sulfate kinase [Pyrobaculum islandicum]ABL88665.1 adenylylsulfate kinase [Pyrobaculum islandicum DSM 4184]